MAVAHPHDAFFKKVFSDTNNAAGELQSVLPTELARRVDWSTLTLQPGSFVDDALRGQHTDLLFSVELDGDKRQVLLYLLFEHFSDADRFTAYRTLRYVVRIWEAWRQENKGASTLPAVIPVVLHHDEKAWSAPRNLTELLDLPDELRESLLPYLPQLTFVLDDLAAHDDKKLQERAVTAMAKLALLLFKHARHAPDLLEPLIGWGAIMAEVLGEPNGVEAFITALRYTMQVRDDLAPQQIRQVIKRARLGSRAEAAFMNVEQQIFEKGVQQGIQQGVQKGVQRGLQQGEAGFFKRMLVRRFGVLPSWATERIDGATSDQLDQWSERFDAAQALVDVIGPEE